MKKKLGIIGFKSISGGAIVILEYASRMFLRGNFDVYVIIKDEFQESDFDWFPGANEIPKISYQNATAILFDVVIATAWKTCYDLEMFTAKSYIYFNQSVESRFYDPTKTNLINYADATYLLDLNIITEATWIKDYIYENFEKDASLVRNGINKTIFSPYGKAVAARNPNKVRILLEGPLHIGFKNVLKSIEICKKSKCDEIWLLTSSPIEQLEGIDKIFSRIPYNLTGEIYRSCDILVKLSTVEGMFGPPLEMFHCGGTAITYNVSGHDEYMVNNLNSQISDMNDDGAVLTNINNLVENKTELQRLKINALKTAESWPSWDEAVINFERAIENAIENPSTNRKALQNRTKILNYFFNKVINQQEEIDKISLYKGYRIHYNVRRFLGLNN